MLPRLVVSALLALPLRAQCPDWSNQFVAPGSAWPLWCAAILDDGSGPRLHVATTTTDDVCSEFEVRRWDADHWTTLQGCFYGDSIRALTLYDDGAGPALFAAGSIDQIDGNYAENLVAWNGTSWRAITPGTDGAILALQVFDDGTGPALYAAGEFTTAGATTSPRIARWNGTSWSDVGGGLLAGEIDTLATFDFGAGPELVLGGSMTLPNGAFAQVARWNGVAFSALGSTNADVDLHSVSCFATFDFGAGPELVAGGSASQPWLAPVHNAVARWNGTAWSPVGTDVVLDASSLCVFDSGNGPELHVQAAWTAPFPSSVARWNGTNWEPIGTLRAGNGTTLVGVDFGGGQELVAAGSFLWSEGVAAMNVARWNGTQWSWPGQGIGAWQPKATEWFDDGTGGRLFTAREMGFFRSRLATWNGAEWRLVGAELNNTIRALQVFDDGSGNALYAGGLFTQAGGQATTYIARWNGTSWSDVGGGMNLHVYALAVHDDGQGPELVAAGKFTNAGGVQAIGVAHWNGTSWAPYGGGIPTPIGSQTIVALASVPQPGGGARLYAAGTFLASGGAPATRIACWDGASWQPVGGAPNDDVLTLEVGELPGTGHVLFAGGRFTQVGVVAANHVARWDGSSWSALGAGVGPYPQHEVRALAWFDDGNTKKLVAGGHWSIAGTMTSQGLVEWDGSSWTPPAGGVDSSVDTLFVAPNAAGGTSLWVSGYFTHAGGVESFGLARLDGCPPPIASFCAGDGVDPFVVNDCPCANFGASGHGCAWSANPQGALLATSGAQNPDTLVLHASGMPTSGVALFWKADAHLVGGTPWGDGVRCITGSLVRLGTKTNAGGAALYPEPGNSAISARGATPPGSGLVGYYQTTFRNAASFCTPDTYNATNGVIVVW